MNCTLKIAGLYLSPNKGTLLSVCYSFEDNLFFLRQLFKNFLGKKGSLVFCSFITMYHGVISFHLFILLVIHFDYWSCNSCFHQFWKILHHYLSNIISSLFLFILFLWDSHYTYITFSNNILHLSYFSFPYLSVLKSK